MQSPSRTYLFLEYIDGMELYDFLKGQPTGHVPEDIVRLISWQLLGALEYMSGKNVLHRDIKLDNILLNKRGDVKIVGRGSGGLPQTTPDLESPLADRFQPCDIC